jgi:hypothetical protein
MRFRAFLVPVSMGWGFSLRPFGWARELLLGTRMLVVELINSCYSQLHEIYSGSRLCDTHRKSYNPFWTKFLIIANVPHQAEICCKSFYLNPITLSGKIQVAPRLPSKGSCPEGTEGSSIFLPSFFFNKVLHIFLIACSRKLLSMVANNGAIPYLLFTFFDSSYQSFYGLFLKEKTRFTCHYCF